MTSKQVRFAVEIYGFFHQQRKHDCSLWPTTLTPASYIYVVYLQQKSLIV